MAKPRSKATSKRKWVILACVVAIGCRKNAQPAAGGSAVPAPPSPSVVASDADASAGDAAPVGPPAPLVELLHAVPATVRVSSKVANKSILPAHIVDRDLQTAWNSVTGELVGAWIEVTVPEQATIEELRLTVGHTGKSKKGADYFTMNPRITKVTVYRDNGAVVGTYKLDPATRDLQVLPVHTPGGTLRIQVDEMVPGSKKTWRETCVSEVEAWGTPPAGWTQPATPLVPEVEVGDATAGTDDDIDDLCAAALAEPRQAYQSYLDETNKDIAECERRGDPSCGGGGDGYEPPSCTAGRITAGKLGAPWTALGSWCFRAQYSETGGRSPPECSIAVADHDRWWTAQPVSGPAPPEDPPRNWGWDVEIFDAYVIDHPDPQLVIRYRIDGDPTSDVFTVCRTKPKRGCSKPLTSAGENWKTKPQLLGSDLVMAKESGTPPDDELGIVTLEFP